MATEAQINANRRNTLKSTGPRTPEGKARSAQNALKHGLAAISPHAFLAVEDKPAFERLLAGYMRIYNPQHADEVDLLVDAAYCKWRQQRLWNTDTQLVEMAIAINQQDLQRQLPKANAAAHVANATALCSPHAQLNRRYEAQLHRQYLRNLALLRELQAERQHLDSTLPDLDEPPSADPQPAPAENPSSKPGNSGSPGPAPTSGSTPPRAAATTGLLHNGLQCPGATSKPVRPAS